MKRSVRAKRLLHGSAALFLAATIPASAQGTEPSESEYAVVFVQEVALTKVRPIKIVPLGDMIDYSSSYGDYGPGVRLDVLLVSRAEGGMSRARNIRITSAVDNTSRTLHPLYGWVESSGFGCSMSWNRESGGPDYFPIDGVVMSLLMAIVSPTFPTNFYDICSIMASSVDPGSSPLIYVSRNGIDMSDGATQLLMRVKLTSPSPGATTVQHFAGTIEIAVGGENIRRFSNLNELAGEKLDLGPDEPLEVRIDSISSTHVTIRQSGETERWGGLTFCDKSGETIWAKERWDEDSYGDPEAPKTYEFDSGEIPAKMVIRTLGSARWVDVPFEFTDIPLP